MDDRKVGWGRFGWTTAVAVAAAVVAAVAVEAYEAAHKAAAAAAVAVGEDSTSDLQLFLEEMDSSTPEYRLLAVRSPWLLLLGQ